MRYAVAGLIAASLVVDARAATIFSDSFNAGAKMDWGNESGQWRAVHGTYDAATPGNGSSHPVTYTDVVTHAALANFTVFVTVKDLNDGGVWLRSAYNGGAINGVLLVTGGNLGTYNGFYWHVVQNGNFSSPMGMAPLSSVQGTTQKLKIVVRGDTYTLYLGASKTPFTKITTNAFKSGAAGLYDFSPNSGVASPRGQVFDNFKITVPYSRPRRSALPAPGRSIL